MRQKKLLTKALSFLLSGTMLAGMIPAVSVTAAAETVNEGHTSAGYVIEWGEGFEDGLGSSRKSEDKDGDTYGGEVTDIATHCVSKAMRSRSQTDNYEQLDPDNWLYSPLIELSEDKEYQLTFYAYGMKNTFGVYIAVGRYSTDYVQIGSDYTLAHSVWTKRTIDLSEYAGKYIHLAFVHHNSSATENLRLDCVDIIGKPKGYTKDNSWGFEDVEFEDDPIVAEVPTGFFAADKDKDGDTWEVIKADWYAHSGDCSLRSRQNDPDVVIHTEAADLFSRVAGDKKLLLSNGEAVKKRKNEGLPTR